MSDTFDIYTIIFLVLAVFIFFRLRSVLGTRTGAERPPSDPYSRREASPATSDKVVTLPARPQEPAGEPEVPLEKRWAGVVEPGSAAFTGLKAISGADPDFDPAGFLQGARAAYEMIVTAFAQGDRKMLRDLLAKDVFDGFAGAIEERESRGETAESTFVGIDDARIIDAELRGQTAQITVRFSSQLVSAVRDRDGTVIDGDTDKVTEVHDIWTFARETGSRDPNWKLAATGAA